MITYCLEDKESTSSLFVILNLVSANEGCLFVIGLQVVYN